MILHYDNIRILNLKYPAQFFSSSPLRPSQASRFQNPVGEIFQASSAVATATVSHVLLWLVNSANAIKMDSHCPTTSIECLFMFNFDNER
jgi:hypothetical protein